MKIIITDFAGSKDITISEDLEPQGAFYDIEQDGNTISLNNTLQVKELISSLKFILNHD